MYSKRSLKMLKSLLLFTIFFGYFSMANSQELPTRDEIADKYKWDLTDIYQSKDKWEKDFEWVESKISEYNKYQSKLGQSGSKLLEYFKFSNEVEQKFSRVIFYAFTSRDLDLNNGEYQTMADRSMQLYSKLSAAESFAQPEILSIPKEKIDKFIAETDGLQEYEHLLDNLMRMKQYTLPAEQEKMLAMYSPVFSSLTQTYGVLNDAELPFPTIEDPDGDEVKVSHGRYRAGLYSQNREYRKDVYKGTYEPYGMLKGTIASLFNGRIKTRITNAQVRGYESARSAALYSDNIPVTVYDNLINTVHENLDVLHRWAEVKKKVLGVEELHPYDTYVSLFPSVTKEYTFEDAKKIAIEALKPLGEEYVEVVQKAFDNRWIDVYETKGKRSGAYSNSCGCGAHPVILLNWNNTLDDLFILLHELGHNMHSYFTEKHQPDQYANYSIFVAEVASITNESLLLDYLIENAESKKEKLALLEKFLMNAQTTFFRQTRFAEFEKLVHEKAENGQFLNADQLTELFGDLYKKYWGDSMVMSEEEALSWARIPHFFNYNFYVFQYSTGFAAAQSLSEQMIEKGEPAVDKYLKNFIYAGNSDYGINVLDKAGVNMAAPKPIEDTAEKIRKYLDQLEELLEEK